MVARKGHKYRLEPLGAPLCSLPPAMPLPLRSQSAASPLVARSQKSQATCVSGLATGAPSRVGQRPSKPQPRHLESPSPSPKGEPFDSRSSFHRNSSIPAQQFDSSNALYDESDHRPALRLAAPELIVPLFSREVLIVLLISWLSFEIASAVSDSGAR